MFSMSKANDTNAKESTMSFHKIAPVKKTRKPAPAPKKAQPKKHTPKRRPVGQK